MLTAIGVASLVGALSAFSRTSAKVETRRTEERLADAKLEELIATNSVETPDSGEFDDPDAFAFVWDLEVEQSSTENVLLAIVTVSNTQTGDEAQVERLVFIPPPPPVDEEEDGQ